MKRNKFLIVPYQQTGRAIYPSQHEPFLSGNIARRDVIKTISRKAISSLIHISPLACKTEIILYLFSLAPNLKIQPEAINSILFPENPGFINR